MFGTCSLFGAYYLLSWQQLCILSKLAVLPTIPNKHTREGQQWAGMGELWDCVGRANPRLFYAVPTVCYTESTAVFDFKYLFIEVLQGLQYKLNESVCLDFYYNVTAVANNTQEIVL